MESGGRGLEQANQCWPKGAQEYRGIDLHCRIGFNWRVFGDIREAPFTLKEAAQYLEVAEITMRRWVQAGNIKQKK
jgi:hypothetical protein